jgi:hypothetical protein
MNICNEENDFISERSEINFVGEREEICFLNFFSGCVDWMH